MKKIITILMTGIILFCISGCEENNKPPEEPLVLIYSYHFKNTEPSLYNDEYMVDYDGYKSEVEDDVEKSVTAEIQGYTITADYENTRYYYTLKEVQTTYGSNQCSSIFTITFDKYTNELMSFRFIQYPEDYIKKTEYITGEEAKSIADEFLEQQIDLKEWTWVDNGFEGDTDEKYGIRYDKYINNVVVMMLIVQTDFFGNIQNYNKYSSSVLEGVTVPDWSDETYIDGAVGLLKKIYKDKGLKEIKDCEIIGDKTLAYLRPRDLDVVEYMMNCMLVFEDGTEENLYRKFYYAIPD
ncbi:hypothetical protein EOM82_08545 [bacterium]|nr:hypothetical protein [bacterium]